MPYQVVHGLRCRGKLLRRREAFIAARRKGPTQLVLQRVKYFGRDQPNQLAFVHRRADGINPRQAAFFHRRVYAGDFAHEQAHIGIVTNEHHLIVGAQALAQPAQIGDVKAEIDRLGQRYAHIQRLGDYLGCLPRAQSRAAENLTGRDAKAFHHLC